LLFLLLFLLLLKGLTETFAGLCATRQDSFIGSNVGVPGATAEVRLIDVEEMGYYASENKGEICVRGTTLFAGYHKRDDLTKEVMDDDNFFHTGDIGFYYILI
jgi:long-chain acyl-CoA synthetase